MERRERRLPIWDPVSYQFPLRPYGFHLSSCVWNKEDHAAAVEITFSMGWSCSRGSACPLGMIKVWASRFGASTDTEMPFPATWRSQRNLSSPVLRCVGRGLWHVLLCAVFLWRWFYSVFLPDWQVKGEVSETDFNPNTWAASRNAICQDLSSLSRGVNLQDWKSSILDLAVHQE